MTRHRLWQGEDKDSSDVEWGNSYVDLDPISQLGLAHRCSVLRGGGAHLVRDVFLAADLLHRDAMSQMDGNTDIQDALGATGNADVDGELDTPSIDRVVETSSEGSMNDGRSEQSTGAGQLVPGVELYLGCDVVCYLR